jgi:hypothetical protein
MPKLKHEKFEADRDGGFVLYRSEIQRGKEIVFAIAGTDLSILAVGYQDIDFDAKSDKEIADAAKTSLPANLYFRWIEREFFPCEPEEINYKPLLSKKI